MTRFTEPEIRTRRDGSIDVAHYTARAQSARARLSARIFFGRDEIEDPRPGGGFPNYL